MLENQENNLDIAITGISCKFPGAENVKQFWHNLCHSVESISYFSDEELLAAKVLKEDLLKENYVKARGAITNIDQFDASFFGFSPKEAQMTDPQQRLFLEHAWLALEDAGIDPARFPGLIGVYAGSNLNTYLINNILSHKGIVESDLAQQILLGNGNDYLATRIAYQLNLKGPAVTVQTACSTSLVAVYQACQSLLAYQSDAVIVGAAAIAAQQKQGYLYFTDGIFSNDGHCRPFDNDATGTVFGSGIGVVVLRRLEDALNEGDDIYAIIKSVAVNNDGSDKVGYTAPSIDGQMQAIQAAHAMAGIPSDAIAYIETHGTATQLGDPVEIAALKKAFTVTEPLSSCGLGSVKSNIGHLDTAAGLAGLIKVALSLQHKKVPPTLNFKALNSKIDFSDTPFYVNANAIDFSSKPSQKLYMGLSSFGIGGTNAHAVLSETITLPPSPAFNKPVLIVLSAKTEQALFGLALNLAEYLENHAVNLASLAYTLQVGRQAMPYRYVRILTENDLSQFIIELRSKNFSITHCQTVLDYFETQSSLGSLQDIAHAWTQGYQIEWSTLYSGFTPRKLHLPTYCFEKQSYWLDPFETSEDDFNHKDPNIDHWFYLPSWKKSVWIEQANIESLRILLFIDEGTLAKQCLEYCMLQGYKVKTVLIGEKFNIINNEQYTINPNTNHDYISLFQHLKSLDFMPDTVLHFWSMTKNTSVLSAAQGFNDMQLLGLYSILNIAKTYDSFENSKPLNVAIVSNYLSNVSGSESINPNKSTLLAAAKVIPKEYIHINCRTFDLEENCKHLNPFFNEITAKQFTDVEVSQRSGQRWVRDYEATLIPECSKKAEHELSHKTYLIIGGLGHFGLEIASYFSKLAATTIILMSRSTFPNENVWDTWLAEHATDNPLSEKILCIKEMQARGAKVEIVSADISKFESINAALQQILIKHQCIHGVIHAAGEVKNGIIACKNLEDMFSTFAAKTIGCYHICDILAQTPPEFIALCSSMNAIIGGLGQIDNTAANVFIDSFAEYQSQKTGQRIFSINWGAVNASRPPKVNVLPQFYDLSTEHKKNHMTDEESHAVYQRLLSNSFGPRMVISPINFDTVLKRWSFVATLEELSKDRSVEVKEIKNQQLIAARTATEQFIATCWCHLLGLTEVSALDNFFNLGGNSLAAIQFINKVEAEYGIKIHVMNIYEMPTLREIAAYVEKINLKSEAIAQI